MSLEESLSKVKTLRSTKIPTQQRQVALLDAVEGMLRDEKQELNATAYFAALLSLLERPDAAEPATELLAYVVPHVSKALLASKIDVVVAKLLPVLLNDAGTALARSSIAVLESILVSVDANAWRVPLSQLGAQRTLSGVLALAQDARPKIRKRAVDAVKRVLTEGHGGHKLAYDAAFTALESSVGAQNQQKLLHTLQLLKIVLGSQETLATNQIDELLAALLQIVRGADQFTVLAVFGTMDSLPANDERITKALMDLAPSTNDKQLAPAWIAGVAQRQPAILDVASQVTTYLLSDHAEIIESAGQCLIALISECMDPEDPVVVQSVANDVLFPLLQVKFHGAWATVCEVCAAFIATLPYELAPRIEGVINIVKVVGALRSSANEADQVLGAAIRILGPARVCELVPLQLDPQTGGGRAWLLPLLAEHTVHTELSYYFEALVPLAKQFEGVAKDLPESRRTKILQTVADQLFTLFPRFCDECQDGMTVEQLQEVLGWLYSRPNLRPSVCLGLKLFVETSTNAKPFALKYGTDILKALLNAFQAMQVDSRGFVLETVEAYLDLLPKAEVSQLFNQVSSMLAQSLAEAEARHTLMDIINTVVPFLDETNAEILFNLFKTIGSMDDALMQKKAYRVLVRYEPGIDYQKLAPTLLEMQPSVMPNARKTRLQALSLVGEAIPNDGDFSFVFRTLPEAILGTKDPNEKTRDAAFNLLIQYGNRMSVATSGIVDHANIPELGDDDTKAPVSITEYFEMIMAGLAGSTPHMIAATATALARVLFEFHQLLPDTKLQEYIELVWMLLESPNREIVTAALGFVKVSVLIMPLEQLKHHLSPLLTLLLAWSNDHKNHFKGKVRHLIERLLRRCGYEALEQAFPESEKKLLHNIQKSKERSRRKRGSQPADAQDEVSAAGTGAAPRPQRKFDNEFDEALYGSDSEGESDVDDENTGKKSQQQQQQQQNNKSQGNGRGKGRKDQFILGGADPLDLLDERALNHISSTKPKQNAADRSLKHQLPETKDGKLVIGRDTEADKEKATADALAAYMDAVREGPVRTQSGKLKYRKGKKAQQASEDHDDEPTKPQLQGARVGKKNNLKKHMQRRKGL